MKRCGALIRVSPEAMTKLLALPEGCSVLRFQSVAGVLECLAMGPGLPEITAADGPMLMDVSELKPSPAPPIDDVHARKPER
jgi:hypothetical protein